MLNEKMEVYLSQDVECEKHGDVVWGALLYLRNPARTVYVCLECLGEALAQNEREMDELAGWAQHSLLTAPQEVGCGC